MKNNFESRAWNVLVAHPSFCEGIFDESVVLLIEDNPDGSMGVIINRPFDKTLEEFDGAFSKYEYLKNAEVFFGGPVPAGNLCFAVWLNDGSKNGNFSFGVSPEEAEKFLEQNPDAAAAAFLGYAGWGAGQLDSEIREGSWYCTPADLDKLADFDFEDMWMDMIFKLNPIFEKLPSPPETDFEAN